MVSIKSGYFLSVSKLKIIIIIHCISRCLSQHSRSPYKAEIKTEQKTMYQKDQQNEQWIRHYVGWPNGK